MKRLLTTTALLALSLPGTAQSDEVILNDLIVTGNICTGGFECEDGEVFGATDLRVKGTIPEIQFFDTSTDATTWTLSVDDTTSGLFNGFTLKNETEGVYPVLIEDGTPPAALFIEDTGNVGFGTAFPQKDLHIINGNQPAIRLEQDTTQAQAAHVWDILADERGVRIDNVTDSDNYVFRIRTGAAPYSLYIDENSYVGLGTSSPSAPLEVAGDDSFNFFRITANDAAINQSVDVVFTEGPLGTGEFRYNIVDGDGPEMRLNADGDMVLDGTLTTGGPTCDTGCDAVFDAEFERLSVTDHAALMWDKGHLPAVGPTLPGAPLNVSEKMGAMLNELEHAHIYIEELHRENAAQEARFTAQETRIEALTAQLAALTARLDQQAD